MTWPHSSEVPVVECRQVRDLLALGGGDDRSVHETEAEIRVLLDELDATLVIGHGEVQYPKVSSSDRTQEPCLGSGSEAILDEPSGLGDDRSHDEELGTSRAEQIGAVTVARLVRIGRREQDTGID